MEDIFLAVMLIPFFIFGYFVMDRLDKYLDNDRKDKQ